jgi:pyridoxal phosphate enzyme (YggS family)
MDAHCPDLIATNIAKVRERVTASAQQNGRTGADITLMAVSKTRSAGHVRAAAAAGIRHFGENYLQEALGKIEQTRALELCWHFIGPLQSNKTRAVALNFDWVHSVERERVARRLSEQRPDTLPALNICLQVNISGEASKSGVEPAALVDLAAAVAALPRLRLRGLMAIPAPSPLASEQRAAFARLAQLQRQLQAQHPQLDTLSMGMSADLESAIAEGATMVRVGSDIFGPRAPHPVA